MIFIFYYVMGTKFYETMFENKFELSFSDIFLTVSHFFNGFTPFKPSVVILKLGENTIPSSASETARKQTSTEVRGWLERKY